MLIGPHLSSPLPILLPIYSWLELPKNWIGLKLYDLIAWSQAVARCVSEGAHPALCEN